MNSIIKTIRTERIKLKRSPVWLAFFALPIISAFFGTFNYLNNLELLKSEWYSLWSQHSLFLCYFFMPALIGTYCSYLWRLEHTRHNWNSFLTAPVPIFALYLGKLVQAAIMIVLSNIWIFLLFYLCGRLSGIQSAFPVAALEWFVCGVIGGIVICCLQLLMSLVIRSFAVPIGIGLVGGIGGLLATSKGWGLNYPYSLYSMGMRANKPQMELDLMTFGIHAMGYIIVFIVLSVFYLHEHEMAAG
ncbi:MAG: ABC transporter permease [Lachnospiraceae bacterium]|nr:ABC transporter permease [Lachnospiraceae bacterium]